MKALILAAGLGTRLRPLTEKTPKPLLLVGDKPLLEYHLDSLEKNGVESILINTHYLPEQIVDFSEKQNQSSRKMRVFTVFERGLLGSAGTLKANKSFFDGEDDFFIVYGDNLTNIDYKKLLERHKETGGVVTIASYVEPLPETKGIIVLSEVGKIERFIEKPKKEQVVSNYANAGIYVVNKRIFDFLESFSQTPFDFGHHLFPYLLKLGVPLYVYHMDEMLLDIGTLESYTKAQDLVKNFYK